MSKVIALLTAAKLQNHLLKVTVDLSGGSSQHLYRYDGELNVRDWVLSFKVPSRDDRFVIAHLRVWVGNREYVVECDEKEVAWFWALHQDIQLDPEHFLLWAKGEDPVPPASVHIHSRRAWTLPRHEPHKERP